MPYKRLWILVEGNDDGRFFEKIKSSLEKNYDCVHPPYKYQQKTDRQIKNFLKSIEAMNSSYFVLKDINNAPCVTTRKNGIKRKYGDRVDIRKIVIIIKEIESWYLAGLSDRSCNELKISTFRDTDNITKEKFNQLIPKKFDSRIDFMTEILKRFSVEIARKKNKSFNYFMSKI